MTSDPLAAAPLDRWLLDPAITHLNHGSFGACPRVVLDRQAALRAELERQPVDFFLRRLPALLDHARARLAAFIDAPAETLAFVRNVSAGLNAVLRSLRFGPGDEILVTDHGYGAATLTAQWVAKRWGARVVTAALPFPAIDPDRVVEAITAAVTPCTRLALIDHVTSPTGLVLPIERIVAALDARGIDTLVDGAHAPGMVDVSLRRIGAAYYAANLHKWVSAPKGAAFLWVRADKVDGIHPLTISHGHGISPERAGMSRFRLEFDWTGTDDPTPWLCVPDAIDTIDGMHSDGWSGWRRRNRALALAARDLLADALGPAAQRAAKACHPDLIGTLVALPLPDAEYAPPASPLYASPLQDAIVARGVEVPIVPWPTHPQRLVRVSAAPYNRLDDYRRLAEVLPPLL